MDRRLALADLPKDSSAATEGLYDCRMYSGLNPGRLSKCLATTGSSVSVCDRACEGWRLTRCYPLLAFTELDPGLSVVLSTGRKLTFL